jgi:predicted CoA-binding protein
MTARLDADEVLALAWLTAQSMPHLRPEVAADVLIITLEKAGYKIVPIEPKAGECQKAVQAT